MNEYPNFEQKRVDLATEAFLEKRRPPEKIRSKLDIAVRCQGQSVIVVEIRPIWDKPSEIRDIPVAKATYVQTHKKWKIFWMRADLKWHGYKPASEVPTIEEFFAIVDQDAHGCFWG
jgi:hypothetical protein